MILGTPVTSFEVTRTHYPSEIVNCNIMKPEMVENVSAEDSKMNLPTVLVYLHHSRVAKHNKMAVRAGNIFTRAPLKIGTAVSPFSSGEWDPLA